jgi:hypothetical protein
MQDDTNLDTVVSRQVEMRDELPLELMNLRVQRAEAAIQAQ